MNKGSRVLGSSQQMCDTDDVMGKQEETSRKALTWRRMAQMKQSEGKWASEQVKLDHVRCTAPQGWWEHDALSRRPSPHL